MITDIVASSDDATANRLREERYQQGSADVTFVPHLNAELGCEGVLSGCRCTGMPTAGDFWANVQYSEREYTVLQ